jgi:dihydroorotate dehydrogenase (NAD+) catalytic subunit
MLLEPFYDPMRSYQENFEDGPFGLFAEAEGRSKRVSFDVPRYRFLGQGVGMPFGIPAGPLVNGRFVKAALDSGFDIPVYKTVRTRKVACHPWPNVLAVKVEGDLGLDRTLVAGGEYAEPLSITNSFGVPSFVPDFWQPDMAEAAAYAGPGQVVVGSFQGTAWEGGGGVAAYLEDFRLGARLVRETGVKVIEVNLSCPNEGTANLLCFDTGRARRVVEAIKDEIGDVPLVIKVAYFREDARLGEFLREVGKSVQGVSAINTISAAIVDAKGGQALPGAGRLSSGVCGSAIQWAGLEMVERLRRWREELGLGFEIVGVGGVEDAAGFERFRGAGADVVMSATGAMWKPGLALEIKDKAGEIREHARELAGERA